MFGIFKAIDRWLDKPPEKKIRIGTKEYIIQGKKVDSASFGDAFDEAYYQDLYKLNNGGYVIYFHDTMGRKNIYRDVTAEDIRKYFPEYAVKNNLGTIERI